MTPQQLAAFQQAVATLQLLLTQITPITPGTVLWCKDPAANNYNPAATQDDGSCTYDEQR